MALAGDEETGRVPERQISSVLLSGDHICFLHSVFDSRIAGRINHGGFSVPVMFGCSSSSFRLLWVKTCLPILSLPPDTALIFKKAWGSCPVFALGQSPGTGRMGRAAFSAWKGCTGHTVLCSGSSQEQVGHAHSHLGTWCMHTCTSRNFVWRLSPGWQSIWEGFAPLCSWAIMAENEWSKLPTNHKEKLETDFENLRTLEDHVPFLTVSAFKPASVAGRWGALA